MAEQEQYGLYHLEDVILPRATENPYMVTLTVAGKPLQFEVDTGASLSLVSEATYRELWPNTPLHDSNVSLRTYTGTPLKILGVMEATISYSQQSATLPLLVIAETGVSLMGHNWLEKIIMIWHSIHKINSDKL